MSRSPAREPVVLLVRGAHHGSLCWEVTGRLGATGVRSPAVGLPFTCFTDDTEAVSCRRTRGGTTRRPPRPASPVPP
ncbi:hypothetical protein ACIHFC_22650 [Streptomyces sp. NPDC052013]|uniref:hypothetical protein n=1 Tax=Streptomyces sp. NPDC052013 TaxID=3365679 RepID=UPI0037CD24E4